MAGMIVCPQPEAAEEGLKVLRRGGNAVDAAVTTAFVQGVIDPQMCGIGGCGVMLVHSAREGTVTALEFYARAGEAVRPDQWEGLFIRESADRYGYVLEGWVNDAGYQSVGVPGTVAGLDEALRRFGTISWEQAIAPAIPFARDGFLVSGNAQANWVAQTGPDIVPYRDRIQWTPESKAIYTKSGALYEVGERLLSTDYARTLERLARHGAEDFYRGEIAAAIAADFAANGGFISLADLAGYRVRVATPVEGSYRGLRVVSAGPPAGGVVLLQMLNFLEGYELGRLGWPSVESARLLVEAMSWAFADRELHLADPEFRAVPVERLLDRGYAASARERLGRGERFVAAPMHEVPSTTHTCVTDGEGNAVTITHTLGSSSGVVTPGLGFTYNNYMNCFDPRPGRVNSLEAGKTRITMMTPTIAFRDGRAVVVLGAPGGTKIVTGVLQTLVNHVDHGMDPVNAVSAPRIDCQGDVVQAEQRVPMDVVEGLRAQGYVVNRRLLSYDAYFARTQLIAVGADGSVRGASDPRKDGGTALAV